ncbi:hypothetical protein DNHGIG_33250 [Collibacillus ludicampi]|uniref:SGNH hydrolase-type esterase domain-containing protein n=1 Tax=Collibacillus ludicampi TaxID=2771369 RepID=A0AAV4LJ41_9BACL|nr:GDSL-type esterase/lipase family protein [Collibacillus ludicampi]GIM47776.1 hypothetical protein DNHGIG_33250 [Collibacillus ludicampi]
MFLARRRAFLVILFIISALLYVWLQHKQSDEGQERPITYREFEEMVSVMIGSRVDRDKSISAQWLTRTDVKKLLLQSLSQKNWKYTSGTLQEFPVYAPVTSSELERMLDRQIGLRPDRRFVTKKEAVHLLDRLFHGKVVYTALGDSLARGVGDHSRMKEQIGYVGRFRTFLEKTEKRTVITNNLGIKGLTSSELLMMIRQNPSVREAIREATLLSVHIGGNDLLEAARAKEPNRELENNLVRFRENWNMILIEIRKLNPQAELLVLNNYIPFPRNHPYHHFAAWWISKYNRVIETSVRRLEKSDPFFLGLASLPPVFDKHEDEYISKLDGVHPNGTGYQMIANEIIHVYQAS